MSALWSCHVGSNDLNVKSLMNSFLISSIDVLKLWSKVRMHRKANLANILKVEARGLTCNFSAEARSIDECVEGMSKPVSADTLMI